MGWDSCSNWKTKKHVVDDLKGQLTRSGSLIIKEKCTTDGAWFVIEKAGETYIYFALIKKERGEYALKTMDETWGPSYYSCPISFFAIVACPDNEIAKAWREKVFVYDKRRQFRPYVGLQFELYGKQFTITRLQQNHNKKRWIAMDHDGKSYYLKSSQYKDMNPILPTEEKTA